MQASRIVSRLRAETKAQRDVIAAGSQAEHLEGVPVTPGRPDQDIEVMVTRMMVW